MWVRSTIKRFHAGARREPGYVFEVKKLGKGMEVVDAPTVPLAPKPEPYEGKSNEDLRAMLADRGVKTAPQTGRKKLISLLNNEEKDS